MSPPAAKFTLDITKFSSSQLQEFRRTKVAMVFQQFGLMDNRNVLENTYYGLELRGIPLKERTAKAQEMLAMVGLEGLENKKISSLSGGMKQRVGIARALTNDPDILLMDEAFSALDPLVKNDLQFELLRIQEKMNKTIIFITHDINEAFRLGNHIAILRDGAAIALRNMRNSGLSSAYVVDEHLHFVGIITLDNALKVLNNELPYEQAILTNIPIISDTNASVEEIMPLSAQTPFPLPVVDNNKTFCGIITKASVLSSFVLNKG